MLLARNMLSAFFYSLRLIYVSWILTRLCLATKMHDIYEERIHIPAYVHVYYIYTHTSSSMHLKNITKPAKFIKWNQCLCTQHVVFA